ncbi:unnamed protein product [Adineta steineri]|uniref:Uncharacterized protein n=1 Tax=Adineta steineri TaxID=433720 RepID=A0A814ULT9_9BILA|nr:unnamed protein product [Adineta steineri]CAF1176388.1 unnamed protein product [Adineta steineri]
MTTTTFTTFRMCPKNTSCDFYLEIKNDQYTTANRIHMDEYGQYCDAFIRLCKNGYQMHDIGHCTIYLHVDRRGELSVEENMNLKKFTSGFERWEPVYHGLRDTEVDKYVFNNPFKYGTFVSTSWDKEVSFGFMCEKGCLLEIDTSEPPDGCQRLVGADVSWISKFPVECEFLIARNPAFEITEIEFDIE